MQTYRLEWNLCEINGVLNFTYTSYENHIQSLIFNWKWFSVILQKKCSIDGKVKFDKIDS